MGYMIAHLSHASQELSLNISSLEAVSSSFVLQDKFADAIHHVISAFEFGYDAKVAHPHFPCRRPAAGVMRKLPGRPCRPFLLRFWPTPQVLMRAFCASGRMLAH